MNVKYAIIDVGISNVASVENVLERAGVREVVIATSPAHIQEAGAVILPGVGHFDEGASRLRKSGFEEALHRFGIVDCRPVLGICLGMQLMFESSEEGRAEGLGWFKGRFEKFSSSDARKLKIPHMGWAWVDFAAREPFQYDIEDPQRFYFVHSYRLLQCDDAVVLARTEYGQQFVSAVMRNNLVGVQFHPEKSHRYGIAFIERFVRHAATWYSKSLASEVA